MTINSFFEEQTDQSLVKSTIVAKYFEGWARVIINTQKKNPHQPQQIAYIDLFAGPGRYKDGALSTPIKILRKAIENPDIRDRLVTVFNDKDEGNTRSLESAIAEIPGIKTLKYKPRVYNEEVGTEIVNMFEEMKLVPTLLFVDPFGYKGLSIRLVNSVLKDWACECLFFFNYLRISMGLSNSIFKKHMDALFGEDRAEALRKRLELNNPNPEQREEMIIDELRKAIRAYGWKYPLPFRFKDAAGSRTSHHLFFVTKEFLGYEIMKSIMAKESTRFEQGVPSFEYNPADLLPQQSLLFPDQKGPLDFLNEQLLEVYAGRTLSMRKIYEEHSVDTRYLASNYKEVLINLERNGIITGKKPDGSRRKKGTFADDVLATFLNKKE